MNSKLKISLLLLLCLLMILPAAAKKKAKYIPYKTIEVENFRSSNSLRYNRLRGQHGTLVQKPSTAKFTYKDFYGVINYNKAVGAVVGFYSNIVLNKKKYLDARNFDELGITGYFPPDRDFFVALVGTKEKNELDRAKLISLTDHWQGEQLYLIPLSAYPEIDLKKVTNVRIYANTNGPGEFKIQKIKFFDHNSDLYKDNVPGAYLIDHFNDNLNRFGQKDRIYSLAPSEISVERMMKDSSQKDRCLKITAVNKDRGWSIYANSLQQGEKFFDARPYKTLIFKVRGAKGGEDADIAISDKNPRSREVPWRANSISRYLGHKLTKDWEEVHVPLDDFGKLPLKQVRELFLIFPDNKTTTIFIDDLSLSTREFKKYKTDEPLDRFNIHSFDNGLTNDLGNRLKTFEDGSAKIKVNQTLEGAFAKDDPCLKIEYTQPGSGLCGFMTSLKIKDKSFDASEYNKLAFQVRGGEAAVLEIYLVDQKAEEATNMDRSATFKRIKIKNLTGQWQWVLLPLRDFEVDTENLAAIVVNFPKQGKETVYIDKLSFLKE
ncbi:hypothetical protein ACFL5G_01035 [Candidatus Margulisiibacteriota bacterium]